MNADQDSEIQLLRESEEKYHKMFERANDAVFVIDVSSGAVLETNPKAREMTGYSVDEMTRMKVWDLHPPEEEAVAKDFFQRSEARVSEFSRNLIFSVKTVCGLLLM